MLVRLDVDEMYPVYFLHEIENLDDFKGREYLLCEVDEDLFDQYKKTLRDFLAVQDILYKLNLENDKKWGRE